MSPSPSKRTAVSADVTVIWCGPPRDVPSLGVSVAAGDELLVPADVAASLTEQGLAGPAPEE